MFVLCCLVAELAGQNTSLRYSGSGSTARHQGPGMMCSCCAVVDCPLRHHHHKRDTHSLRFGRERRKIRAVVALCGLWPHVGRARLLSRITAAVARNDEARGAVCRRVRQPDAADDHQQGNHGQGAGAEWMCTGQCRPEGAGLRCDSSLVRCDCYAMR